MPWWTSPLSGWWRAQRQARHAPPEALWSAVLAYYPFLTALSDAEQMRLHGKVTEFLSRKQFSAASGLEMTDDIAVAIGAQACLPLLNLPFALYDSFVGVVVHPDEVVADREWMDDDGVVHQWQEPLSGEAMEGGPVMLSWQDATWRGEANEPAYNVVIHEFAHVLDMGNGFADGVPALPSSDAARRWLATLESAYATFCLRIDQEEPSVIDPYGAESIDEFFAVACEAFFVAGAALQVEQPTLYKLLADYFQQDPASRR